MQIFWGANSVDKLEKSALLRFEIIFDYQKIYAIIYDCSFLADIDIFEARQKSWVGATSQTPLSPRFGMVSL